MMCDAWKIKEENFPETGRIEEKIRFLLNYAILAPSSHNTQPWRFLVEGNRVSVYADSTRGLPRVDPEERELHISVGCAVANLLIAAEHFGLEHKLEYFPGEEKVVTIELSPGHTKKPGFVDLFHEIAVRHTNRNKYEPEMVGEEKFYDLRVCVGEGFRIDLITDQKTKFEVAELVAMGDIVQLGDKTFRRELASWVRHNWTRSGDGMPGFVFGVSSFGSLLGSFFIKNFNLGKSQAKKDKKLVVESPAIGVLSSAEDNELFWVRTGIVFEKLMLMATRLNIQIAFLNQPIEVPELRTKLQNLLGITEFPQLLFRMGYSKPAKHSPRRRLEEVII